MKARLRRLKQMASEEHAGGCPIIEDADFRKSVAELEIKLRALEFTELRFLMAYSNSEEPGAEVSMLKIRGTEIQQELTHRTLDESNGYVCPPLRARSA